MAPDFGNNKIKSTFSYNHVESSNGRLSFSHNIRCDFNYYQWVFIICELRTANLRTTKMRTKMRTKINEPMYKMQTQNANHVHTKGV